ncbi:hypothetical protein SUGI_0825100 [Cryptomeria japonica]|nr:hypothetical protein SUGI_0825100 [Cryptomeria japonica]
MRIKNTMHLASFSAGGNRQVFASCPKSISVFSPPCKRIPARNTTVSNARRVSSFCEGDSGRNNETRARNAKTLSLPSDGRWQVYHSKKTLKKMGNNKGTALNMDKRKQSDPKLSPATGANLVPLGKVRIFEPKPNFRQRHICMIPDYLMDPQFNLYSNYGVFVKWTGFGDDIERIVDWWLALYPGQIKSIEHKENPISDQNVNITLNSIHDNADCPPVTNTDENIHNSLSNINDLDKIIDEANSIKAEALVEMSKRISDSVDSLKSPSETKTVENLGQEIEADQEVMSSRMAAALEVFNNNEVENLSPEEEDEKRFLIQELLASMDMGDNNENREEDISPLPVNDYTTAQSQLGEDDGEGVTIPHQSLGIANIYDGKNTPDCAREAKSRGRKSLSELRLQDGNAKDQGKLTAFFDAGKGKGLPTVQ